MSASASAISAARALAEQYVHWEFRAEYRSYIQQLLSQSGNNASSDQELVAAFSPRIAFGTAGLRARMAAGYHNINELVVLQTSQGFARYVAATQANPQCFEKGIVLGYDGRHNSRTYAEIAAAIFLGAGFKVFLFRTMVGTPFVPFAVGLKGAAAGIMVTASHNPKDDNGYKVYWANGAQIIPPHDAGIAAMIEQNLQPWHLKEGDAPSAPVFDPNHPRLEDPFDQVTDAYFADAHRLYCWREEENKKLTQAALPVTFTAMHGVGAPFTARALKAFGLPEYVPTKEQVVPDPEFPTVKFPNPEEGKGALALAMKAADAAGSKLILANDPDADRLAVAEKTADGWHPLNGNQIAILLADWTFQNYIAREKPTKEALAKSCMVASTVSSAILAAMAKKEGFNFYGTLTGFKWMGNRAHQAVDAGERFLFAYEVEIGFLVGNMSYDKDGIRTAAIFYEMYADLHRQGLNCHQKLDELYKRYGYFNMNTSYFFCDPASGKLAKIFARLRNYPGVSKDAYPQSEHVYPTECGGVKITSVRDVTYGYDNSESDYRSRLPIDTSASMLTFRFENGCTATLRNSGTEPKLKYYIECHGVIADEAAQLTKKMSSAILETFVQPKENQLEAPKVVE